MPMPSNRLIFRTITTVLAIIVIPLAAVHYYREFQSARSEENHKSDMMSAVKPQPQQIIIVGAGLAGLSAAHAALTASTTASVLLLERAPKPGGNSIKASSGINGAPTRFQPAGSHDSAALFREDTVRSAGVRLNGPHVAGRDRRLREALISTLTDRSASAVHFLHDTVGVDLSVVAQLGGHGAARTHRGGGKTPPGFAIVSGLLAKLKDEVGKDRFELRTGCEVTRLLTSDGGGASPRRVIGIEYHQDGKEAESKPAPSLSAHGPVVFAAGGFAGDAVGLLAEHRPDLGSLPSTNDARPGAHGILARDVAASLVDMDSVQVHPTGFVDPKSPDAHVKFLAAEMLRGEGGILLTKEGRRFVNEMDTREKVSGVIMSTLPPSSEAPLRQWDVQFLLDPGACAAAEAHIGFYMFKGLVVKKKVRELDEATRRTIREYSAVVRGERADEFGRTTFGHWRLKGTADEEEEEVCLGTVTPIVHFTMGGAAINEKAQVLQGGDDGAPASGLWAAGEITGGIHGDNRLGGSSLLECVVFGRIAGEEAARYAQQQQQG